MKISIDYKRRIKYQLKYENVTPSVKNLSRFADDFFSYDWVNRYRKLEKYNYTTTNYIRYR